MSTVFLNCIWFAQWLIGYLVVCCLDSFGHSNLGNIFDTSLEEILNTDKVKNIIKGFNDRYVYLDICKHCSYKDRFKHE